MFKKITFFLALGLVLLGLNANAQTTRFIVNPASSELEVGDILVVSVTSQDFTNILGFGYSMNWDPNVLQFINGEDEISPVNLPPALTANAIPASTGAITFSWNDPFLTATSIDDDLVLYEIVRFVAIAPGTSPINFSSMPTTASIVYDNGDEETPLFTNGTVTVNDPNPPTSTEFECTFNDFGLAILPDSAATGEQLCLPVHLCNGDDLVSFIYSINFNPAILQFDSITNINLPQPEEVFENSNNTDGWVRTLWSDASGQGVDVPDTLAYEICFTVVGAGGDMDTVRITGMPGGIEVTKSTNPGVNIGMEIQNAPIVVSGNSASAITVVAANIDGSPGDTVCVAVTAQNFDEVTSFQYTFTFDETNLQYLEHRNFNDDIPNLGGAINDSPMFTDNGEILVVYPNAGGMSSTLMDGDTLYEVCFIIDPMATLGTDALVGFSDDPVTRGASQMTPTTLLTNNGSVGIIAGEGSGDFELNIGNNDPFCSDSVICVPVTVEDGFDNVVGGSFRVNFPTADLTYDSISQNPFFPANGINWLSNNPNGTDRIILIMDNSNPENGVTLPPGTVLFDICFVANSAADVTSPITYNTSSPAEFVDPDFMIIEPIIINDGAAIISTTACPAGEVDITVSETIVNVPCNGESTGSIMLDINGGDGSYDITWTGSPTDVSGLTTPTISNLEAGTYTVSITSGSRDFTNTYTITESNALIGTTVATNVTCNGDADGSITVTPDGGVGPYTFSWNNNATDQNLSNLAPGNYTVTITDANMCTFTVPTVTIAEPAILEITIDDTDNVSCLDGNDGAISTTVSGGNGDPSYVWSNTTPTQTTGDITNLTAGNYRVTVTDSRGCTAVSPNITITQPSTAVSITVDNIIPAGCDGGGSIFITPSGGDNFYEYEWNGPLPGPTTQDNEDIPAGGYTVTVTDNSGCSFTSDIIVVPSTDAITIDEIITQPTCDSEANGAINLTVGGGTGNDFTYIWDPTATTEDLTGLTAGTYEVTVTDTGDGCTVTAMYQLTNSTNLTITEVASTPAGCAGATNGSLTVQVNGGGNYSYEWSEPGQNTATISNVAAGTYTLTVTDDNSGCTQDGSFTIDSEGGISITGDVTDASCAGAATGSIDINVSGAGANPTFEWSNMADTEDIENLVDEEYIVTVTSTDGQCTQTAAFTVEAGGGFVIEEESIGPATCDGANNGTVDISVNGATGTPDYEWSTGSDTQDINNAAGTVTVTVTDQAGCVEIASYVVPFGPGFDINSVSIENASCGGAADGSIDIELDGAAQPLMTLEWEGPDGFTATTEDIDGLTAGMYTVFVTDDAGCNATATYTVDNDGGISAAVQNIINVSCDGSMDGSITLDVLNASDDPSFEWSLPGVMGQSPVGLAAGTYAVTITDNESGCTDVITGIEVENPTPITFTTTVEDASCNGANDGTITINAAGGNGGFVFSWSHDDDLEGNVATGLAPGSYIVTITDSRGCSVETEGIIVGEPTEIIVTGNVTGLSGAGNNGEITVTATGGTGTYSGYDWTGPTGMLMGQTITGLSAGSYTVTVTDDNGCTGTGTFDINDADAPNPTLISVTDVTCFGGNDGAIMVNVTGGAGNYTYTWQVPPGGTNIADDVEDPTGLIAGTYNLTVTDANGVTGLLSSIVVGQPQELDYDLMDLISVSCSGFLDGEISINPTGGNGEPYTVDWGFLANDSLNLTDLAAGNYTPTITDALGCTVEGDNVIVQEPMEISIAADLTDPSCDNGGPSGSIILTVTGGTQGAGYTYEWSGPNPPYTSTSQLTNIGQGTYFVTVTDSRNCTAEAGPYTLEDPGAIIIQLDSVRHVRCAGIPEGAIFVTASGGSGALSPQWKNGQGDIINNGFDLQGLIGGNYTLCVTDDAGCSETLGPITINEPQPITVNEIEVDNATASADDGEIRLIGVNGGTPDYTFDWEGPNNVMQSTGNTPTISDIPPGEWRVTITDANGCTEIITDILVLGSLNVQATLTDPTCNNDDNGSIVTSINGGDAPFQCSWTTDNGSGIVDFACDQFSLTAGDYTLSVEDANGVVVTYDYTLENPEPITVTLNPTDDLTGDCSGSVSTSVMGGTLPYDYTWNNGASSSGLFDLCKGEYAVTVIDANGCVAIPPSVIITEGPLDFINENPTGAACDGGDGGSFSAEISGGCGPFTFELTGGNNPVIINDNLVSITGLDAGMYDLTVTDLEGTMATTSFTIAPTNIVVTVDTIINNTGMPGMCNGAVNITPSGGQLLYTFVWSNGATSEDVANVCENESPLSVVVTDANGCVIQSEQFILIRGLSVDLAFENESCAGDMDGSIIATVDGGTPGYSYLWSNGEDTPNLTGLVPGSYTITVTDSQGRTVAESATINGASSTITVTSEVTVPTGTNADGAIDITTIGGAGGNDYEWQRDGIVISTSPDIGGLTAGTYVLTIEDAFGCTYFESFNLAGAAIALQFISGSSGCPGQAGDLGTLQVVPSGGTSSDYSYLWDVNGNTADIIGGLAPGDYTVTVTDNASGLTAVGTGNVVQVEEITIDLQVDEVNSNITSIVTGGTPPYNYSWNDPDFSATRDLMDVPSGTYTLVISDANGCVNQATVELLAGPCEQVRKVISPNNDGFNDEFIVSCANRFEIDLEIYNRWGQLEFMAPNYSNNWLGTDQEGAKLPEGGYFYVIRYQDSEGQTQQIKGSINIVY